MSKRREISFWNPLDDLLLIVLLISSSSVSYVGQWGWLNFRGEWGNSKNGCDLEPLSGECRLNHGPIFPGGPDDMPPPRIQRSRQASTISPIQISLPPPPHLAYTPTLPPLARIPAPAGRASGLLNYRYKRRDPQSDSLLVVANTEGPVTSSDDETDTTEPANNITDRLVTSVPEDFVASTTIAMMTKWFPFRIAEKANTKM